MNEFSKNAKYALVAGESTETYGPDKRKAWQEFLATFEHHVSRSPGTKTIHDNVWLIPLDTEMRFFSKLLEWGRMDKIALRILFLDEEPNWILYPPAEKPKAES